MWVMVMADEGSVSFGGKSEVKKAASRSYEVTSGEA